MGLVIERVETAKQLREFIKVPWNVYRDDPAWVPWLFYERLEFFDKKRNHFFEVDDRFIVLATLRSLAREGQIKSNVVQKAIRDLEIDPEKPNPVLS